MRAVCFPIILTRTRATLIAVLLHLRISENLYIILLALIKAAGNSVRIFVSTQFVPTLPNGFEIEQCDLTFDNKLDY